MKGVDIADRLKEVLPVYTTEFSDIVSVTSLTKSGSTVTAVSASAHSLATGSYVTIDGAKNPITLTSLTRVDNVVTAVSSTDHLLSDPSLFSDAEAALLTVTISGATSTDYNDTFQLLTVPDDTTFTFRINTTPTTPATTAGYLLLDDYDGYNGYKLVTVLDTTTFTYESAGNMNSPAQGTITLCNASRIAWAATSQRADAFYSDDANRMLQNWMFVVMGSAVGYKDDTVASDISSATDKNREYFYQEQQDFSVYIFLPTGDDTLGATQADLAKDLLKPILKSIGNYQFGSNLTDECYQPTVYVGNETEDYNTAYYIHRFDFMAKLYVQEDDTADFNPGTPLLVIDGTIEDKDMTYKPTTR